MKIEDKVKLADIAEVVIQDLYKKVYAFQVGQLVVSCIHAEAEKEASISPIHHFIAFELQHTTESG